MKRPDHFRVLVILVGGGVLIWALVWLGAWWLS